LPEASVMHAIRSDSAIARSGGWTRADVTRAVRRCGASPEDPDRERTVRVRELGPLRPQAG